MRSCLVTNSKTNRIQSTCCDAKWKTNIKINSVENKQTNNNNNNNSNSIMTGFNIICYTHTHGFVAATNVNIRMFVGIFFARSVTHVHPYHLVHFITKIFTLCLLYAILLWPFICCWNYNKSANSMRRYQAHRGEHTDTRVIPDIIHAQTEWESERANKLRRMCVPDKQNLASASSRRYITKRWRRITWYLCIVHMTRLLSCYFNVSTNRSRLFRRKAIAWTVRICRVWSKR